MDAAVTDLSADLEPDADDDLVRLAQRLRDHRPLPATAFRGRLRRDLLVRGTHHPRPPRLRALVTAYAGGGALLLVGGAASAAGVGPLAG
jgi:hypothetical protein